jgi:glycosyltransferase involved in cell wall biosynthesis
MKAPQRGSDSARSVLMTLAMQSITGAGQVVLQYGAAFRRQGWRVVVACGPPPASEGDRSTVALRALGVEVRQLDRVVAPTWPVWRQLRAIADEVRPAVVIGIGQRDRPIAMALSASLGVPGIVTAQNQHVFWGSPLTRLGKRVIYGYALRKWATLVVCVSEPVQREIQNFGIPASRTILLPNGVPIEKRLVLSESDRVRLRSEFAAGPEDVLLINVGRLDIQKGQDILVEAFGRCASSRPWLRLVLIGDVSGGPNRYLMEAFAASVRGSVKVKGLNSQITFAGWRSDVPRLLASADGYVHAARWEGFSFAVLEAMAASLPVVITDCSGRPESFEDGVQGWMVPKGDAAALALAIARMADASRQAREQIGEAGRTLVEAHYDVDKIGLRFAQLVGEVAAHAG